MSMSGITMADNHGNGSEKPDPKSAPTFEPVGGPVSVAWRESTLTRAYELEALCDWAVESQSLDRASPLVEAIKIHLKAAREAACGKKPDGPRRRSWVFGDGPRIERARSNLDAAEAQLLNIASAEYILGQMPSLLRHVQRHLKPTDPGRQEFEWIARGLGINDPERRLAGNGQQRDQRALTQMLDLDTITRERGKIVTTVRAASSEALRVNVRLRSFRNVVALVTVIMTMLALGVAVVGYLQPTWLPLCFSPQDGGKSIVVCPTNQSGPYIPLQSATPDERAQSAALNDPGSPDQEDAWPLVLDNDVVVEKTAKPPDLMVVELVGLIAAAVASAAAIRTIKGSSERYGIPLALAMLKLPTGAVTAFLGLMLMRGNFVPGLSALDSTAQILAWALVFGFAQELFTRLVDQQGHTVLNTVRASDIPKPDKPA
jgi:hypothetical protein